MRLLLVEDNVPLADELIAGLQRQGYAVDWLADGRDAVYQGQSEPYDLIILDLGLPGLPGLDVLAQWRAEPISPPLRIQPAILARLAGESCGLPSGMRTRPVCATA